MLCVWVPWTSRGRISCAVTHRQPASLRGERTRTFPRETALHHTSRIHIPAAATGSPPPSPRNSLAVRVYSRVCHVVCRHGMIQGPCCVWSQVFHTLPWLSCAGEDSFHHNCKDCCLSVGGHPTLYPPTSSEISHSQLVISPCTLMITHNKRFTINKTFSNDCLVVVRCTWKICETIMHKTTLVGALKKYISRHIASALKPSQEENIISFGEFGHYT